MVNASSPYPPARGIPNSCTSTKEPTEGIGRAGAGGGPTEADAKTQILNGAPRRRKPLTVGGSSGLLSGVPRTAERRLRDEMQNNYLPRQTYEAHAKRVEDGMHALKMENIANGTERHHVRTTMQQALRERRANGEAAGAALALGRENADRGRENAENIDDLRTACDRRSKVDNNFPPPELKNLVFSKLLGLNLPGARNVPTPLDFFKWSAAPTFGKVCKI